MLSKHAMATAVLMYTISLESLAILSHDFGDKHSILIQTCNIVTPAQC